MRDKPMIEQSSGKIDAALSTPPAAVAAISMLGVSLQDWVLIATLAWVSTQFGWFIYQRVRDFTRKEEPPE